jgi:hypothetical protein
LISLLLIAVPQAALVVLVLLSLMSAARRRGLDDLAALAAGLCGLGLAGFAMFWLAWLAWPLVWPVRLGFWCWGAWQLLRRGAPTDARLAGGMQIAAAVLLVVWVHAGSDLDHALEVAAGRWVQELPVDNRLPLLFARMLAEGAVRAPLHGDWLSSDRPPLQTGLYLLFALPWGGEEPVYQICCVVLQLLILPGAYLLARALGAPPQGGVLAMVAVFSMPAVILNATFVWPKLLSAAFLCVPAAALLSPWGRTQPVLRQGALAGAGAALAMLSHGTAAFALLGLGTAAVLMRRLTARGALAAALVAATVYAPWMAYQKLVDPPGDRLIKMHLAGVGDIDPRGLGRTLADSYRALTPDVWLAGRLANLDAIFALRVARAAALAGQAVSAGRSGDRQGMAGAMRELRIMSFFRFPLSAGLLGAALYLLPLGLLERTLRPLAAAVLATLAAWALLMFTPGSTIVHQGSLFPQIALVVGVLAIAGARRRGAALALAGAQAAATLLLFGR